MMRFLLRHGAVRLIGGRAIPALMLIDLAMLANRARRNPIVDRNLRRGAGAVRKRADSAFTGRRDTPPDEPPPHKYWSPPPR
ncbi:MAG: hypothetical protein ACJ779_00380 [Chloroflexota bacterium]